MILAGRATRVPQAAVTNGTQRSATVTPRRPLRWARATDLHRRYGATLHGMQGVRVQIPLTSRLYAAGSVRVAVPLPARQVNIHRKTYETVMYVILDLRGIALM